MNIERLLATAIRILGLYIVLNTLYGLGAFINSSAYLTDSLADNALALEVVMYAWVIIKLIVAAMMVIVPISIAQWIVPGQTTTESNLDAEPQGLEVSAFLIIGVAFLARAIPDIIYNGIWLWYQNTDQISERLTVGSNEQFVIGLITALVGFGIGLYLILGAQGLQRLISKIRRAGVS